MDPSTSPNDLIIINTRSRTDGNDFRLQMSTEFDELNNNVSSLTESRASLQQQQTSKQSNNQNIDQSNIVALKNSSSSSCQLTTTIEISNDDKQQQEKQFNCKHCKASFYTHNALSMHIEVFHKSKSESVNATQTNVNLCETSNALFKCCDKVFYTVKEVRIHMQMHIGLSEYKKNVVNPGTISKSTQNEQPNHESEHQFNELTKSSNQFCCLECGRKFLNKRTLYNHIYYSKNVHQKQLQPCEVNWCGKQFKTKNDLYCHYLSVHKAVKFPCTQCNKFKKRKDLMANHLQKYHEIEYPELNSIPSEHAVASLSNCDQQNNYNDGQLDDGHGDDEDEIEFIGYHQKFQQQEHPVTSTTTMHAEKQFHKCKWAMCDRVFMGLENMRTHILNVHVYGLNSDDREDSGERSIETQKTDQQSIEVNLIEPILRDVSLLNEIVINEQLRHISHDHIYHQTDHFPTPPLNANASLLCTFAECGDLTFNHLPNLLRHTRLKHPDSLHPVNLKSFRNCRRTTQSNHVLKNVLTSKIKCSLCEKWFQWQYNLEIHVIQKHMAMEMFTGGISECTMTIESDEELEIHCLVDQPEHQITGRNELTNDKSLKSAQQALVDTRCYSNDESVDETDSVENASNETNKSDENSIEKMDLDDEELHQAENQQQLQELNESTKSTQQLLIDSDSNDESIDEADLEEKETNETNYSDEESFEETGLENDNDLDDQSMNGSETDGEELHQVKNQQPQNELNKPTDESKSLNPYVKKTRPFRCLHCDKSFEKVYDLKNHFKVFHTIITIVNGGFGRHTRKFVEDDELERHGGVIQQISKLQINGRNESTNDKSLTSGQSPFIGTGSDCHSNEGSLDDINSDDEDSDEQIIKETDSKGEDFHLPKLLEHQIKECNESISDKSDQQLLDETSFSEELLKGSNSGKMNINKKSIDEVADETEEFLSGNEFSQHSVDSTDSDSNSKQPKHQQFVGHQEQQQLDHCFSERLSQDECSQEESDFDDQILGEMDSDERSSEVTDFDLNDLHPNADCNLTTNASYVPNAIDNEECVDYLAEIQIDNLDYQNEIDMTNDQVNPSNHLSTPLSDCIMLQSNTLSNQPVSSNLDQFSVNLDQSSPNLTQSTTNPISVQSNVHLNQPNSPTHLPTPILDCIMFPSNPSPSQSVFSSLDQFTVNLNQPSPKSTESTTNLDPKCHNLDQSSPNKNSNHTLFQMNQNPVSPNFCINLEAASEQSSSIHDISDLITFHSNQPNPPTNLCTSISDCIVPKSNPLSSQSILSSLEQFCANQPNPNSIPNNTFFQMNQNPNDLNYNMNLEAASEQSIHDISDLMTFQSNQNLNQQSPNLTLPDSKSNSTLQHINLILNPSNTFSIVSTC